MILQMNGVTFWEQDRNRRRKSYQIENLTAATLKATLKLNNRSRGKVALSATYYTL